MNKIRRLLLIILIVITGCKNIELDNKIISQVIDNFDMTIYSNTGKKLFSISSPNSNYEINGNIFNLKETTINLFKNNNVEYIINSDQSKLSNNKLIELNGNVLVKNKLQPNEKLYANSFRWNTQNSNYLLSGKVKFENSNVTLKSNKAELNKDVNIIKFFKPVNYLIKDDNQESRYEINSENAFYNINTKTISFGSKEERVRSKIYN